MNISTIKVGLLLALACPATAAWAGGDIEHGKELATKTYACASCHGADFKSPIDPTYPKLAGQHPDYLAHALTAYKHTDNPSIGRKNAIMAGQAAALSATEIQDLAAYLGSLPSALHLPAKSGQLNSAP